MDDGEERNADVHRQSHSVAPYLEEATLNANPGTRVRHQTPQRNETINMYGSKATDMNPGVTIDAVAN